MCSIVSQLASVWVVVVCWLECVSCTDGFDGLAVLFVFVLIFFVLLLFAVFNLTYEVDVDETRLKVEEYRKNNQSLIQKNKARAVSDIAWGRATGWCGSCVRVHCVVEHCKLYSLYSLL